MFNNAPARLERPSIDLTPNKIFEMDLVIMVHFIVHLMPDESGAKVFIIAQTAKRIKSKTKFVVGNQVIGLGWATSRNILKHNEPEDGD